MAKELSDISGVGPKKVEKFNELGINSVSDLAEADITTIEQAGVSSSRAKEFKDKANRSAVIIQSGFEVEEEYANYDSISTGIPQIDECIEGGWEQEAVVSIYGSDGSGKTQLCKKALVEGVRQTEKDAIYIETEKNRFRPERIKALADGDEEILNKVHRVKAYDLDRQENSYEAVCNQFDEASIVIVDSLVARFRLSEDFGDRTTFTERSSVLGRHLQQIERMAEKLSCPVLFTNQVYGNPDQYGRDEVQYGGSLVKHTAQFFVYMKEETGEMHSCNIEKHPSEGNNKVMINITENDIVGTSSSK